MNKYSVLKFLERWAPPQIAWQKDNVGLQAGSLQGKLTNIMLCLEVTQIVVEEAIKKRCNLIISHHPFLFSPLKKIDTDNDTTAQLAQLLLSNNLTLLSFHTNLDFAQNGVSFALAKKLQLQNIEFLVPQRENQSKLIVFVPESAVEKVADALFLADAGRIGEYDKCSFRVDGEGTFFGSDASHPAVGKKKTFEKVKEVRFEVILDDWNIGKAVSALKSVHPYEQPAFDIYPVKNENTKYGFGTIGSLKSPLKEKDFLNHVSTSLKTPVRYTDGKKEVISKVAVCGGSGSELLKEALAQKADAFVTADIKYHSFFDANGKILLVDAGHYETEIHILPEMKTRLEYYLKTEKSTCKVFQFGGKTSPVKFFIN